jgi:hypothetical protein
MDRANRPPDLYLVLYAICTPPGVQKEAQSLARAEGEGEEIRQTEPGEEKRASHTLSTNYNHVGVGCR